MAEQESSGPSPARWTWNVHSSEPGSLPEAMSGERPRKHYFANFTQPQDKSWKNWRGLPWAAAQFNSLFFFPDCSSFVWVYNLHSVICTELRLKLYIPRQPAPDIGCFHDTRKCPYLVNPTCPEANDASDFYPHRTVSFSSRTSYAWNQAICTLVSGFFNCNVMVLKLIHV